MKTEDKTVDLIPEHLNLKCAIEENLNKYKLDIAQKYRFEVWVRRLRNRHR